MPAAAIRQTGGEMWSARGSASDPLPSTKVSTVGVNVQSDSELKAELFGEVKINFACETVPLDRFVDDAQRALLERHSRAMPSAPPAAVVKLVPPAGAGRGRATAAGSAGRSAPRRAATGSARMTDRRALADLLIDVADGVLDVEAPPALARHRRCR